MSSKWCLNNQHSCVLSEYQTPCRLIKYEILGKFIWLHWFKLGSICVLSGEWGLDLALCSLFWIVALKWGFDRAPKTNPKDHLLPILSNQVTWNSTNGIYNLCFCREWCWFVYLRDDLQEVLEIHSFRTLRVKQAIFLSVPFRSTHLTVM